MPKITASAHLDGFEFAATHERIGRRGVDLQLFCYVCKGEESGHVSILPPLASGGAVIHSLALFGLLTFDQAHLP
ncbi:hypothetical protein ASF98_01400 [Arthrobacter sp. Leaf337]|nr:hypothetical protein ASF98_01400 [Arthrobacter sp. Leaf337]